MKHNDAIETTIAVSARRRTGCSREIQMNSMRKALCFVTALLLAVFAAPGFAGNSPTKMFSVTLSAAAAAAGQQVVTATFFNQTPSGGNSTINSVILYAPSPLKFIDATTPQGGTFSIAPDGSSVSVINMPGIKAGQTPPASWSMTVTLDASAAPACKSTDYPWPTPYASTGNTPTTVGGVPFAFQAGISNITTTLSSPCSYSLNITPSTVTAGTSLQSMTATYANPSSNATSFGSLKLTAPSGFTIVSATPPSGAATIAAGGGSVTVSGITLAPGGTFALALSVNVNCTAATASWGSAVWSGTPVGTGNAASIDASSSTTTTVTPSPCTYRLTVTPSPVTAGTSAQSMTATYANPSSNGTSFGSLSLTAPSGFTIVSATPPTGTVVVAAGGGSVTVSGITSLASGGTFALALSVNVNCSATTGNWVSVVSSGTTVNTGTAATLDAGSSSTQTAVTGGCSFKFLTQPSNALKNAAISPAIVVGLVDSSNNVVTTFAGQVTLTQKSGPGTLSGTLGPVAAVNGQATFNSVMASAIGDYVLKATSGSLTVDSNLFTIYDGELNCRPTAPFNFSDPNVNVTDPNESGYAAGSRGYWNKDGMNCVPILYTFTNTILSTDETKKNTVHLAWDTATQQHPAFTYSMTWQAEDVDNPSNPDSQGAANYGWPVPRRPYVYWLPTDASVTVIPTGSVPALTCVSTDLPAPYAMLDANIGDNVTTITVDVPPITPAPPAPPAPPYPTSTLPPAGDSTASPPTLAAFPIVIDTERMKVTKVVQGPNAGQYTLTVVRGDGLTQRAAHVKVDASKITLYNPTGQTYVMSTPLPIDSNPASPNYNVQVPMCVVNHGWMAAGSNPITGIPQIRYFTTVYDIGDGWVTIPR
jgi:hypothetical protein